MSANFDGKHRLDVLTGVVIDSDLDELDSRVAVIAMDVATLAVGVDGLRIRHGAEHLALEDVVTESMEVA